MLEIKNLTKKYGDFVAVSDLSLHVKKGEIYGFIGHNGAGKSTVIKAIVGAHKFDGGEIIINGNSLKEKPIECKKDMAYVPDNPDIYDYLTGIQYLNFIGDIYSVPVEERDKKVKEYAGKFEISDKLSDLISSYSHGMKQKLVLISALMHSPKLLILDEPFVGLDPVASFNLKEIMKDMCSQGASIFFSTHILEVAEKLCDRVGIIKGGKIVTEGEMKDIVGDESLESIFLELQK